LYHWWDFERHVGSYSKYKLLHWTPANAVEYFQQNREPWRRFRIFISFSALFLFFSLTIWPIISIINFGLLLRLHMGLHSCLGLAYLYWFDLKNNSNGFEQWLAMMSFLPTTYLIERTWMLFWQSHWATIQKIIMPPHKLVIFFSYIISAFFAHIIFFAP
jgi:hypothetical protein